MVRRRLPAALVVAIVGTLAWASAAPAPAVITHAAEVVAHEWGTFTSVAGPDGDAVTWAPLGGTPQDLPCFVERYATCVKCEFRGTVRMETPVIYFYANEPTTVRVSARFRQGLLTEWYPHASVTPPKAVFGADVTNAPEFAGTISWPQVTVRPGATEAYLTEDAGSHYYVARNTDAAPVQVGTQTEKFLFYRGVGVFQPPLTATIGDNDSVRVRTRRGEPVGDVIRFENRGGVMAYDVRHADGSEITIAAPRLEGETVPPTAELEHLLIAHGLFAAEARAMVATWRDSWFEEGSRLFYIASQSAIEDILPLDIQPRPRSLVRVFVGRIELATSATRDEITSALKSGNGAVLARYRRFALPLGQQAIANATPAERSRWESALATAAFSNGPAAKVCK